MSFETVPLESLAAREPGAITDGPFGSNLTSAHYTTEGPQVVRLQNIGDGAYKRAEAHISSTHFESLRKHEVVGGDLLVASLGDNLPRACLMPADIGPAIVKADCIRVRLSQEVDPRWVLYALQRPAARAWAKDQLHGVGRARLGLKTIRRIPLPIVALAEQRRIIDILEDHLSRLDAGVQSLDAAHRRFDGMRVTRVRQLLPPSTLEATLGSVTRRSGYGTSTKCVYDGPGAAVTRIPNLVGGRIDLSDLKRIADPAVSVTDLMLQEGDLLVIRTNGSRDLIGRSAVVQAGISASFASYLIRFQLDPTQVIPDWVHLMLSTPDVRRAIETRAASSAGQYNLSLAKLNTLSLPLPTIGEQATILSEMEGLDATTIRLAATLRQTLHRAASLRRALLTAAFSGKLTGAASDPDRIEELAATT